MSEKPIKGSKDRILFLERYLTDHTDDERMVSLDGLIRICEENGYRANWHTIKDDMQTLMDSGMDIISEREGGGKIYYHIGTRLFEVAELKMLVDAVSSSRFITKGKSETLVEKLTQLTNEENRSALTTRVFTADRIKTSNPVVFQTVDTVCRAIEAGKKISFRYIAYTPAKEKILRNEGRPYITSPYALIWNDDRYYLAAAHAEAEKTVTFRIDRMQDLVILEEDAEACPDFNPSEYASQTLWMYDEGLKEQTVTLACRNPLMQNVIDRFGEEIETEIQDSEHFTAHVEVRPSSTFFSWVFGFRGEMRIAGPEPVRESYETLLKAVLEQQLSTT